MKLDLTKFPRLGDDTPQKLFQIFNKEGITARFVGGCIRDALLGIAAYDIDIAVPLSPDKVIEILAKADVKVIPTGYNFGTITAVVQEKEFQITSLRQDWEGDGRYARVTYGTDWEADAARRDFTINALYADADGRIYDYFGGIKDLDSGLIRFIGLPSQRIQEDYLRILRYFRFFAWYGKNDPHPESLQACIHLKEGLQNLSRERIGHEFLKLLAAPYPLQSLHLIHQEGLTPFILPTPMNLKALENLLGMEQKSPTLCRLAALSLPHLEVAALVKALRLSNEQKDYLETCQRRLPFYPSSDATLKRNLYRDGSERFMDLTLLSLALNPQDSEDNIIKQALEMAASWQRPHFPLNGKDLMAEGIPPGILLGTLLRQCEDWWIDQDFLPTKEDCLQWAKANT